MLEVLVVTTPNDLACSYLLHCFQVRKDVHHVIRPLAITYRYDFTISAKSLGQLIFWRFSIKPDY